MPSTPVFENSVLVTNSSALAAQISALFVRPGRYFPVLDGPRLARPDADNEVVRRRNAIVMTGANHVVLGALDAQSNAEMSGGWTKCTIADQYEDHVNALRGWVKRPATDLEWGPTNLGIGLYLARIEKKGLSLTLEESPAVGSVLRGSHLLVACEGGNEFSQVLASNLAFSNGASLALFPGLREEDQRGWLEEMYGLGDCGDVTARFVELALRARNHLGPSIDFESFGSVLFVTAGFPWGIAISGSRSTHMYLRPDFGRAIVEGLWASQSPTTSARTALLVDPLTVAGSEMPVIRDALVRNGTLTRVMKGPDATNTNIQYLLDLLPHDIIVFSSHAGDAPGQRITYEYEDADGKTRRLKVDEAVAFGYDRREGKFSVTTYQRFHSLDGVDWHDKVALESLPVGSAMTTWATLLGAAGKKDFVTGTEAIPRVQGSMALQLHDGPWLFTSHGFSPLTAPLIVNNSCWSWHELSERTTFAGARAYVGTLFPITDGEAEVISCALFGKYIGKTLVEALWLAQRDTYGSSTRRPYVMVGLPFVTIFPNTSNSITFLRQSYRDAIADYADRERNSPHDEIRQNCRRYVQFLREDLLKFLDQLPRWPPQTPPPVAGSNSSTPGAVTVGL